MGVSSTSVHLAQKFPLILTSKYRQTILTKGDNNVIDDRFMYLPGRPFALRGEVIGLVQGYVPKLGWASLALQGGFQR